MSEPRTIPKFGSFRPNPTPTNSLSTDSKVIGRQERKHRSKGEGNFKSHDTKREDKTARRHRHHRRSRSKSQERSKERNRQTLDLRPVEAEAIKKSDESEAFFIDTKGDEKNLVYGSIHRYDVPVFRRTGGGNVIGTSNRLKIDRYLGDGKYIVLSDWRDSTFGPRERYTFSKIKGVRPRLLKIRPESIGEHQDVLNEDFVALDDSKIKRSGDQESDDQASGAEDEINYRSIHGKKKVGDQPEDVAFQYAGESDDAENQGSHAVGSNHAHRQKDLELKRRVEQCPDDIDAWLELINLQDNALYGKDERHRATNAEIKSTAEIKIYMYEKALGQAKSMADRERLLVGFMSEGSKVWESKYQSDRWEEISQANIDSLTLWKNYLLFKQSTFSTFRYEEIRDIFIKRIKLLRNEIGNANPGSEMSLWQQLIYVLLRATIFIRESGFSELSVAIWQGLIELNFCGPKSPEEPVDRIKTFGEFWETELPRVGEENALGWNHFVQQSGDIDAPGSIIDATTNELDGNGLFRSWSAAERRRHNASSLPARTLDDVAEDDPYRVILFSDVEDFMAALQPGCEEMLRSSLFDAFLIFCRMPAMASQGEESRSELSKDTLGHEFLESDPTYISQRCLNKPKMDENAAAKTESPLTTPVSNYYMSSDTLFSTGLWFSKMLSWQERYSPVYQPLSYVWVRNTLKQINNFYSNEDLAEYYMAFEWKNEPATIKKVCKGLLKQHPTSLRLYNAYAMIEAARGNRDVSNSVFSAAISMSKSVPEKQSRDTILLWKSWVWSFLESSDNSGGLQRILTIPDGVLSDSLTSTPATLLRTKQYLRSNRDYLLSSGNFYHAALHTELLALLEYLTTTSPQETQSSTQGNITSALTIYTTLSTTLTIHPTAHELLLQSSARLLHHHARTGPFRPALLRQHLTTYLTLFPSNTIFLSLYTWNESRLRIENRVRAILHSTVLLLEHDVLTSRIFAITYEIQHGTIHSARSAFEHAVASPACRASPALWRLYLLYCLQTPEFVGMAKDIWYRALNACPWAKELYVLGLERLEGIVAFEELRRTWRVMGEKELRVHVDLEERFEDMVELEEGRKMGRLGFRQ
ncbi:hypothetical protein GLAREA_05467 [Glarea lozoyensis ATCC 20868]|uniref:DUF1740-domain-containing protein n=1 Tax=Glarea lozoyensis (strain ATCC 20868 / MF5171) TaxID=1116229 RepID=S3DG69_GLAL2|nr:uncharacterized protein GLAREA_05467 [Glarea lozoyensis ATCC 20868]EPE36129.1 hypothetical protein GLAREA_05467 [Glarea lozoyensis ATCC 20868]